MNRKQYNNLDKTYSKANKILLAQVIAILGFWIWVLTKI